MKNATDPLNTLAEYLVKDFNIFITLLVSFNKSFPLALSRSDVPVLSEFFKTSIHAWNIVK